MSEVSIGPVAELARGYRTVLAGAALIAVAMPTLSIYALPYFMASFKAEFGWERQEVGVAVSCLTLTIFLVGPWVGRAIDRFGVRRVAAISIVLFAIALAGLSQLNRSIWSLYLAYVALGILGAGASHISYLRAVASWFVRARGVALGFAGAGAGLWAYLAPQFLPPWIGAHGWRSAWLLLAGLAIAALPILLFFIREKTPTKRDLTAPEFGMTLAEAKRTSTFWVMLAGIFLLGIGIVGLTVQIVPLVTEITGSPAAAARAGGLFGLSLMAGRLCSGFLLDRWPARFVSSAIYAIPVAGIGVFASGHPWGPAMLGISLGLAGGAEHDILSYLVSRYFGMKAFSELFGWMFGTLSLGAAIGPLLIRGVSALGWDAHGTLVLSAVLCATAAALYATLGRYPDWKPSTPT